MNSPQYSLRIISAKLVTKLFVYYACAILLWGHKQSDNGLGSKGGGLEYDDGGGGGLQCGDCEGGGFGDDDGEGSGLGGDEVKAVALRAETVKTAALG